MKNLYRQAIYSYRGLFGWLSWQGYISAIVFRPALNMAIYALVGRFALKPEAAGPIIVGLAAYQMPYVVFGGIANCVTRDRMFGTLQFTYVSRGSRAVTYLSKGVMHFPNALLVVAIGLASASVFLGLSFSDANWPVLTVTSLVIALSSTAAALLIGNFGIIINDWSTAYGAFVGAMLALTGVIIPIASLPSFLSPISQILPFTHGLAAFRQAFSGGSLSAVGNNLLLELAIGAVYGITGYFMYRFMEREAKRRGILDAPGANL